MTSPYVTFSYGNSGPEYFMKGGTCPKIFYEVEAPAGQLPLLWVEDGEEDVDTLLFAPDFDTSLGIFTQTLKAYYKEILDENNELLVVSTTQLNFKISNSCTLPS